MMLGMLLSPGYKTHRTPGPETKLMIIFFWKKKMKNVITIHKFFKSINLSKNDDSSLGSNV